MNQVTRKKLWKGFILFALFCNALGVCWNMLIGNPWGAVGHTICALTMILVFLETSQERKEEEEDDEQ